MEDSKIVELYWRRDETAISETALKYEAYLMKISGNILSVAEDCTECVNDTYLAAWNSMPDKRPSVLSTYLGKITRQISIDRYRRNNSKKRYKSEYHLSLNEIDCFCENDIPDNQVDSKQLVEAVNRFVHTLPNKAKNVFVGRYYFFDSVKDIAAYCNLSESNVKVILARTRQKLKVYLETEGVIV